MILDAKFQEGNRVMKSGFGEFNGKYISEELFANAIKGTASGEAVAVNDVSPFRHTATAKVRGKNLIPPFYDDYSVTREELTQSCEKDGQTITINGVGNANGGGRNNFRDHSKHFFIEKGKSYTLSQEMVSGDLEGIYSVYISRMTDYGSIISMPNTSASKTFIAEETVECYIGINVVANDVYNNVVVRFQLEEGAEATEYEPYINPETVSVTRCGKNLISNRATEWNGLYYDLSIEDNVMSSVNANGASNVAILTKKFPVGTYTVQAKFQGLPRYIVRPYNADGTVMSDVVGFGAWNSFYNGYYFALETQVFRIPENASYWEFGVVFTSDDTTLAGANITISNLQLELGDTATEFEPYSAENYNPNADGIVAFTSISPSMTVLTDTEGVNINLEYNRDANKVIPSVDQIFNPESENAQSGKAVAEAVSNKADNEEWEQINSITLEEDSIPIISTDMNGNSFNLKKFMIIVWHEAKTENTVGNCIWLHANTPNSGGYKYALQSQSYKGNVQSTHRFDGELWYYWNIRAHAAQGHYAAPSNMAYAYLTVPYGCRYEFMEYREPITGFRVTFGTGGVLNAGTRIEVWGVRA